MLIRDVMEKYNVTRSAVYYWIRSKGLPAHKESGKSFGLGGKVWVIDVDPHEWDPDAVKKGSKISDRARQTFEEALRQIHSVRKTAKLFQVSTQVIVNVVPTSQL